MTAQSSKKISIFQAGLLVLLAVIAAGIWFNRWSAAPSSSPTPELAPAPVLAEGSPFANSPGNLKKIQPVDPAQMLESVKRGDVEAVRTKWRDAMRVRDTQSLVEIYRLVCKHGSNQLVEVMGPMSMPISDHDLKVVLSGLNDLLDRKQYDALNTMLNKRANEFGLFHDRIRSWVLEQYARDPWDDGRFDHIYKIISQSGRKAITLADIVVDAINGPEPRFEWVMRVCQDSPNNEETGAIMKMEQTPNLVSAATVERILRLGGQLKSRYNLTTIFRACLPHIKPEHAPLVRKMMLNSQPIPELVDYVLSREPGEIGEWMKSDNRFSAALFQKFEQSLRKSDFLEKVKPFTHLSEQMNQAAQGSPQLDVYNLISLHDTEQYEWLWSHGFRPTENSSLENCLYLAIHFKDLNLLRATLGRDAAQVWQLLNRGVDTVTKSSNGQPTRTKFVPLLVAIQEWDLAAVQLLLGTKAHDWKTWSHESPLLLATREKKMDIYQCLVDAGVNWNEKSSEAVAKLKDAAPEVLKDVKQKEALASRDPALQALAKVVDSGDLQELEKVLADFPFREKLDSIRVTGDQSLTTQLTMYDVIVNRWRTETGLDRVMTRAIKNPKVFDRLLAEGFPVNLGTLSAMMSGGHDQVLRSALSDLRVRSLVKKNRPTLVQAGKGQQAVLSLLDDVEAN